VIPKFIDCIIKNEPPPIFGDGGQSRDFTYVENVVSANFLAATVPGIKHEVLNVALEKTTRSWLWPRPLIKSSAKISRPNSYRPAVVIFTKATLISPKFRKSWDTSRWSVLKKA